MSGIMDDQDLIDPVDEYYQVWQDSYEDLNNAHAEEVHKAVEASLCISKAQADASLCISKAQAEASYFAVCTECEEESYSKSWKGDVNVLILKEKEIFENIIKENRSKYLKVRKRFALERVHTKPICLPTTGGMEMSDPKPSMN